MILTELLREKVIFKKKCMEWLTYTPQSLQGEGTITPHGT